MGSEKKMSSLKSFFIYHDKQDLTKSTKMNHSHLFLYKNALQSFRNTMSAKTQTLEDILIVFGRKYVKLEFQVTAKHKWHMLEFETNTM